MLGTCKAIGDFDGETEPAVTAALRDTIYSSEGLGLTRWGARLRIGWRW